VEYLERITDHGQATGKLYHLRVSFRKTCVIGQKVDLSGIERVSAKTIKLVFVASPLSTQHTGERAKTGWLGIRIMCPSGATCLPADCCFS
jgi:hypothetical protein